jgi:cytochrome oxidase Cu insertion factor (SCO1/SenC/PrrC family)
VASPQAEVMATGLERRSERGTVADMLAEGTSAPPFSLPDQNGDVVALDDLLGRWVVLWWYPKASTAG